MRNQIEFVVYGKYALFTDPITKVGGEKFTYQLPTYQALKGICESIYWKPTFTWFIDEVRVLKPIRTQSQGIRPSDFKGGNTLAFYTYLVDVAYEVKAHFEWNLFRSDLEADRNEHKHFQIAKRMLERGGRRDIFLGTRECQGYVEPIDSSEVKGFYDAYGDLHFDMMFYAFDYPSDSGKEALIAHFWRPSMHNGVIDFTRKNVTLYTKYLREMPFEYIQTSGLNEAGFSEWIKEDV
jgi:CRISPR-associated protein Cas5d